MKLESHSWKPEEIEKQSFAIIESELPFEIEEEIKPVVKRVIHTTADFEYCKTLTFTTGVIQKAKQAIKEGAVIVTDTNMGKAGINKTAVKQFGGEVFCYMADEDVAKEAKERGVTRAVVSMEKAVRLHTNIIFAIGNAPTALIRLHELMEEGLCNPALIIAVPVGFVNVVEAKELIIEDVVPSIVARGRKGGSNVAACICNALIYMCRDDEAKE